MMGKDNYWSYQHKYSTGVDCLSYKWIRRCYNNLLGSLSQGRCNEPIPATLESTLRLPRTRTSDLGPLGPQTRHRIRLGPSSTHVVHEVHHIYCVVVSSLYSFFFPSPQTLVPSAIEVGQAPSVLPNSLGEHRVSEVAPNATSISLLQRAYTECRTGDVGMRNGCNIASLLH